MNLNQGNSKELITAEGYAILHKKREKLINDDLPKITEALSAAREHHDYRENGELDAARAEKERLDYELAKLTQYLNEVSIALPSNLDAVGFGMKVKFARVGNESDVQEYNIVGAGEFCLEKGSLSYKSPFAQQMINKIPGDTFKMGDKAYKIMAVSRPDAADLMASLCE